MATESLMVVAPTSIQGSLFMEGTPQIPRLAPLEQQDQNAE